MSRKQIRNISRITKLKRQFLAASGWVKVQWEYIIIMCCLVLLIGLLLVGLSWLIGYWSNGLLGTHFELGSCWAGIGAIVTGLGGVAAMAGAVWGKYYVDSSYNSKPGEMPNPFRGIKRG